jgi:hypothetical protein
MNRNTIIAIIVVLICVLLVVVDQCSDRDTFVWTEGDDRVAYKEQSVQPYGTIVLRDLAGLHFGNRLKEIKEPGLKALSDIKDPSKSAYVFVGSQPYYDTTEIVNLLDFAQRGGKVIISTKYLSSRLEDSIYHTSLCPDDLDYYGDRSLQYDSTTRCFLTNQNGDFEFETEYVHHYKDRKMPYDWRSISTSNICDQAEWEELGKYKNGDINYVKVKYGEGHFYLHSVPLVYTNIQLIRDETRPYINRLFADMEADVMYWDVYAKTDLARQRAMTIQRGAKTIGNSGILSTMLREPALAFSWFILLGLIALFLVFGSKREQRLIPVIPPPKNASLQFVQSLARLQFRQQNFKSICKQDMRYFLNAVRERTGIHVPMDTHGMVPYDTRLLERIAVGSGYSDTALRDLFTRYEACAMYEPSGEMMADLHTSIEQYIRHKKRIYGSSNRSA